MKVILRADYVVCYVTSIQLHRYLIFQIKVSKAFSATQVKQKKNLPHFQITSACSLVSVCVHLMSLADVK
jgi:hypothetical protein